MIGIIGAMDQEVSVLRDKMENMTKKVIKAIEFYSGAINGKSVVLLKSGIGKVNASVATTILFEHYDIDLVINIGSAGGLKSEAMIGDIVISTEVAHHDVDVTVFNYEYGQVPHMPLFYKSEERLVELMEDILDGEGFNYHKGLIVSGDSFMNTERQLVNIRTHFRNVVAVEMEASAIAQVCHIYDQPFIILRSLSDIAGQESNISFEKYIMKAAENSSIYLEKLLDRL
ncbi:5'-methylthioadenosine/S-adenosylhomocysteine nucleosidase [Haloplasma contractile]|uniref:5'-methylthioadenosine/S-adenosylhomocysteine nucleosidase n=1 Tax=Haloplasma contractile SSD-17B TaxID=1033810 RepID=U2DZW2_9MOLU|nr:5'-methylthioadenosine/S-adenosylhomocysteine nucleosidase [Haloplasma contractile]ERJ13722.1 5'-methylthioadenosine-S-adenosylhomocysteine nucleosidase protein [Haloplasma contractile SSD-17B]